MSVKTASGTSEFIADEVVLSLAPGFSRVNETRNEGNGLNRFPPAARAKPLKRLGHFATANTGLKPGANERLPSIHRVLPKWNGARVSHPQRPGLLDKRTKFHLISAVERAAAETAALRDRKSQMLIAAAALVLLVATGCQKSVPSGALVLTQSPATAAATSASDILDSRYPPGSRVVLTKAPFNAKRVQVLSKGLAAAGEPIVSYDGRRVFFTGKTSAADKWQIYEVLLPGGRPRVLTSMPGGARNPALLPDGGIVFASPVPKIGGTNSTPQSSALYAQSPGGQPRQLTFGSRSISEPTMLSDGRILFVSADSASGPALFTINNDGTEITAFAERHDGNSRIERPRELADGRMVYVVSKGDCCLPGSAVEFVRLARPFQSREPLFPDATAGIRSIQPAGNGDLLVCADNSSGERSSVTLFRVGPTATTLGTPIFADAAWHVCDASEVSAHRRPMGRISTMDSAKQTGRILCLDANFTSYSSESAETTSPATHVRVLAETTPGNVHTLGEVPVQADGSFMAEVPADVPLGFEALDENGKVLRREAPMIWLRPGENRACIGCHEPRNRSPRNHRPLAVNAPVPCLKSESTQLTQTNTGQ